MEEEVTYESHTFNSARHALLEAFVVSFGLTLLEVVETYNHIPEFKRRIDLAAMDLARPQSQMIH
jgi:hypothetical protein